MLSEFLGNGNCVWGHVPAVQAGNALRGQGERELPWGCHPIPRLGISSPNPISASRRLKVIFHFPQLSRSDSVVRVKGTGFPCGVWGKAPIVTPRLPSLSLRYLPHKRKELVFDFAAVLQRKIEDADADRAQNRPCPDWQAQRTASQQRRDN